MPPHPLERELRSLSADPDFFPTATEVDKVVSRLPSWLNRSWRVGVPTFIRRWLPSLFRYTFRCRAFLGNDIAIVLLGGVIVVSMLVGPTLPRKGGKWGHMVNTLAQHAQGEERRRENEAKLHEFKRVRRNGATGQRWSDWDRS